MILDIITVTLLVVYFIRGWRKGVILALFSLIGIILGIIIALKLSGVFAAYLFEKGWVTSGWAQILAYVLLFVGVIWLVKLGARLIQKSLELVMLGLFNRIAGGLLYALVAAIVLSSVFWLANQVHAISPETIAASKTFPYIAGLAPWVFEHIGAVIPFVGRIFDQLGHFFNGVNSHLPEHVGAH